jgi:hypothetical protein
VVLEHYQLKHNADIGVLKAGGPFKGKKGSPMKGGWDEHVDTYGPAILAYVKSLIPKMGEQQKLTLAKVRLADIEAYIVITREGEDFIISYHGNPPE